MNADSDHRSAIEPFTEQGWISEILYEVKSGKEATVFCCRGGPASPVPLIAAKVYRPIESRRFKNDAMYVGGRMHMARAGRARRAVQSKTAFGRRVQYATWLFEEWEVLNVLHDAGATVPRPLAVDERAILMTFLGDESGASPLLHQIAPEAGIDHRKGGSLEPPFFLFWWAQTGLDSGSSGQGPHPLSRTRIRLGAPRRRLICQDCRRRRVPVKAASPNKANAPGAGVNTALKARSKPVGLPDSHGWSTGSSVNTHVVVRWNLKLLAHVVPDSRSRSAPGPGRIDDRRAVRRASNGKGGNSSGQKLVVHRVSLLAMRRRDLGSLAVAATSTADVVFKALLYNHATGRSVPDNVDQSIFQEAFRSKAKA